MVSNNEKEASLMLSAMFPPAKGKVQGADDDSTGVNLLAHWFRCGEAVAERNDAEASKDASSDRRQESEADSCGGDADSSLSVNADASRGCSGRVPFDPSYRWPNLFKEADDMVQASLVLYLFADLRRLAREETSDASRGGGGRLSNPGKILSLPMPTRVAMEVVAENEEVLVELALSQDMRICQDALRAFHERSEMTADNSGETLSPGKGLVTLEAFADERSDEELVYAVGLDRYHRRVTVAFRGSVTPNDFFTDACIAMVAMSDPSGTKKEIMVHSGFHNYLFKVGNGRKKSKYDEILDTVVPILRAHPTFKLYATGHSLGGALATLFAFATVNVGSGHGLCDGIPSPVTCVSVASPKVGNESFRLAFVEAEDQGLLRHLRIANEMDPVTLTPPASSKVMLASLSPATLMIMTHVSDIIEREIYKHVGIRLKLLNDETKRWKISFSTGSWKQDLFTPRAAASISHHFGYEYSSRIFRAKEDLEILTLNELYGRRDST